MSIIHKEIDNPCYICDGKKGNKKCKACKGTGIYKTSINYYIDDKKKIAFDSESGK